MKYWNTFKMNAKMSKFLVQLVKSGQKENFSKDMNPKNVYKILIRF